LGIEAVKTASIFFNSILFDRKVNLVVVFVSKKCPIFFKSTGINNIKIKENGNFRFSTKSILVLGVSNSKTNERIGESAVLWAACTLVLCLFLPL